MTYQPYQFVSNVLVGLVVCSLPALGVAQSRDDSTPESSNEAERADADPATESDTDSSSTDSKQNEDEASDQRVRELESRVQALERQLDSRSASEPSEQDTDARATSDTASEGDVSIESQLDQIERSVSEEETERTSSTSEEATPENTSSSGSGIIQSMNPDISFIVDSTGGWASGEADLRGGHDPSLPGFSLQGLELAAGVDVDPFFRFDAAILFSLFGVEIEEAYATSLNLPLQLQMRVGQFKTRFGRLNPTHLHTWKFATQPLVNAKFFGGESLRGMGAELSQVVLPIPGTFRWYLSVQNISGAATGRSFIPSKSDFEKIGDVTVSTRLEEFVALSNSWSLLTGLNYANGRNKTGRGNRTEIYGLDLYLKWKNVAEGGRSQVGWQNEFMVRRRQVPDDTLEDFGGYSQLVWRPNRYWETGARYEYVSGIGPKYDGLSLLGGTTRAVDPLDPNWTEGRHRGAYQITHYPSHFTKLRLQYSLDHLPYRTGGQDEFVHMVFLQTEFVAGSHGAHSF